MIKNILNKIEEVENRIKDHSNVSELISDKFLLNKFESELEYSIKLLRINKRTQRDDIYEKLRKEGKTQEDCKLLARKSIRNIERQELKLKSLLDNLKQTKRSLKNTISLMKDKNGRYQISQDVQVRYDG
jgi:small-conductance mechanosensitive channel